MVLFFLNVRIAGIFSKIVLIVRIFLKNVRIFKKNTDWPDLFSKIVRIGRIFFRKLYGLYGFLLKMYGFFQKSFGHPASLFSSFRFSSYIQLILFFKNVNMLVFVPSKVPSFFYSLKVSISGSFLQKFPSLFLFFKSFHLFQFIKSLLFSRM